MQPEYPASQGFLRPPGHRKRSYSHLANWISAQLLQRAIRAGHLRGLAFAWAQLGLDTAKRRNNRSRPHSHIIVTGFSPRSRRTGGEAC